MDSAKLVLVLTGNASGAIAAIDGVQRKLDGLSEKSKEGGKFGGFMKAATFAGAAVAVGGLTAVMEKGVEAANDDATAMAMLNTAMADAGQKWTPQLTAQLDKTKQSMDDLGFNGAQTAQSVGNLVQAGVPAADAMNAMGTAADYARAKHMDLVSATQQLQLASEGNLRALKSLGITQGPIIANATKLQSAQQRLSTAQQKLTDLQDSGTASSKQLKSAQDAVSKAQDNLSLVTKEAGNTQANFQQIMAEVGPKVKGQADAYSKTLPGALATMQASFTDNVLVPIGQKVIPMLTSLAQWVTQHGPEIQGILTTALTGVGIALTVVGNVLGFVIDHINILGPLFVAIVGPILAFKAAAFVKREIIDGYKGIVGGIKAVKSVYETGYVKALYFRDGVGKAASAMGRAGKAAWDFAGNVIGSIGRAGKAAWGFASDVAGSVANAIKNFAKMAVEAAVTAAKMAAQWAMQAAAATASFVMEMVEAIADFAVMAASALATGIAMAAAFLLPLAPFILIGIAVAALVALVVTHFNQIKNFITGTVGAVINWVKKNWPLLIGILTGPIGLAVALIATHLTNIRNFFAKIFSAITGIVTNAWDAFKAGAEDVSNFIQGIFRALGSIVSAIFSALGNTVKGALTSIMDIAKAIIDVPIHVVNGIIDAIDSVKVTVPSWVPGIGGKGWTGLGIPHVPSFAEGSGWLNSPMLAVIGDNPRGERIQTKDQFDAEQGKGGNTTIIVNNPAPEPASTSVERNLRHLSFMGRPAA